MIYLASPYSHPKYKVRRRRYDQVCRVAANLARQNVLVFCPIAHSVPIARFGLPNDWTFWEKWDTQLLKRCSSLWVLKLKGWKKSVGVQAEIKKARLWDMSIQYLEPSDYGLEE